MKKFICLLLLLPLCLTACGGSVEHVPETPHEMMGGVRITVPETAGEFARAFYEAADMSLNAVLDERAEKKPEYISFIFSSDLMLTKDEREEMKSLFSVYGLEVREGLSTSVADMERGVTVGFGSIEKTQTSDCDLTVTVQVHYGKYIYDYCSDFALTKDGYVLFRFEYLHKTHSTAHY